MESGIFDYICGVFLSKITFMIGEKMDSNIKTVTLVLTEACNLSCKYCYENYKSNNNMPIDVAYSIIDKELMNYDKYDSIFIDFFGGEPFLRFDNIKKIVNYVKEKELSKNNVYFVTSTNGTLVHGTIAEWLKNNKNIIDVGLSLDGTPAMHNDNRSNSFDKIDIDFFVENFGYHPVKMTISPNTLRNMSEGVIYLHELGFKVNCNLAFGVDWSNPDYKGILSEELMKLIDYYMNNSDIQPCSMLNAEIKHLGYENDDEFSIKWCGTSTNMHTYDVNGDKYHCQYFLPNSIGEEKARKSNNISLIQKIDLSLLDDKCKGCSVREACPSCYGANYAVFGDVYHKDEDMCELTKIILKARAYFRALQWKKGMINISERDEELLLKSIKIIQDI